MLAVGTVLSLAALPWGSQAVAVCLSVSSLLVALWFVPPALRVLAVSVRDLAGLARPLCAGVVMVVMLAAVPMPLVAQGVLGTALYVALAGLAFRPSRRLA
jgi:hypothetical protein